ncbi:MAG: glycosyltransferase family 2 protein, partial [Alphaproteobacteria bacterium]
DVLLFGTLRNEKPRLPYFLDYYRKLGVGHFLFVDNGSDDGTAEYLAQQPDVSVWQTTHSYRRSNFGVDWLNWLLARHGTGHWCLTVDADEFFVYPFCDTRPIQALTDWLDNCGLRTFPAMLLDMYPRGPVQQAHCAEGQNPFEVLEYFDAGNYMISRNPKYGNLWIQGGPRARTFFAGEPAKAPALNKIPLVKWRRGYVYVSSTHSLLPRGLNNTYETNGGEKPSGVLLHAKFLAAFNARAAEEAARAEHYMGAAEYKAYSEKLARGTTLWTRFSEKFINWRQLEVLGLMSKGNWI